MAPGVDTASLRLSAIRAFLGVIRSDYRRVGVRLVGDEIRLSVILAEPLSASLEDIQEDVSVAASEIVADFRDHWISEDVAILRGPLPAAHLIDDGLIFQRWEPLS